MIHLRRKDRITIQEKEREKRRQEELEHEAKKLAEDRRHQTLKVNTIYGFNVKRTSIPVKDVPSTSSRRLSKLFDSTDWYRFS